MAHEHDHTREGFIARLLGGRKARWGLDPTDYDPGTMSRTLGAVKRIFGPGRWFPLEVSGWENIPGSPALLVSNHSGGTMIPDAWGWMVAWYEHFGFRRPLHPLGHELLMAHERTGRFFAKNGMLRASPKVALSALRDHHHDLLVMPGGDLDTWRPYRDRYRVRFGGRRGYARLALQSGSPIVPIANAGAHETLMVLTDGHSFAKKIGLQKIARAEIFPIHLSLPWGLAIGPLPHLPLPTKLRYRVGEPIEVRKTESPTDAQIARLDWQVQRAVQGLLDDLAGSRKRRRPSSPAKAERTPLLYGDASSIAIP